MIPPTHLPSDCPCCLWWSERHYEMERQRDNFQASVKDLAGQCLELQQQRDELLKAAKVRIECCTHYWELNGKGSTCGSVTLCDCCEDLQKVIDSVEVG